VIFDVLAEPSGEVSLASGIRSSSIVELNISIKTINIVNISSTEGEFEFRERVMDLVG